MKYNRQSYNRSATVSNAVAGTSVIRIKTNLDITKKIYVIPQKGIIKINAKAESIKHLALIPTLTKISLKAIIYDITKKQVILPNIGKIHILSKPTMYNIYFYAESKSKINIYGNINKINKIFYLKTKAQVHIKANKIDSTLKVPIFTDIAKIKIKTDKLDFTKNIYLNLNSSKILINSYARAGFQGIDELIFDGLELRPGEELTIDLCDLTAYINDRNVLDKLKTDFFLLGIGNNKISIDSSISQTEKVIEWRNKWL